MSKSPGLLLRLLGGWLALCALASPLAARLWTAVDGRTVEAELEFADETTVTILRLEDESSFTLPRSRFSECDQSYIDGWLAARATPAQPTAPLSLDPFGPPDPANRDAILLGYQRQIRDLDFNWRQVGSVLEALGYRRLEALFPAPRYAIYHGLQYHDSTGRTLGEIDLLVFDTEANLVAAVYECKISGNPRRALEHAEEQLARFRDALRHHDVARFTPTGGPTRAWIAADFRELRDFRTVGGANTARQGYDLEIDLSRAEADQLQAMLLAPP